MGMLLLAAFGGCAVLPEPIGQAQIQQRVQQDMQTLFKDIEPLTGELGLHEAFARALKYNYDYRLKAMEQTMSSAQLDVAKFDMLPRLALSAGYDVRSNDSGSRSIDLASGVENNAFTGGQERRRTTGSAALAWNALDFGVSYVRAQQQATQVMIAEERKRKVVQNIAQDVRQAFWRAYGAQKALPRLATLLNQVREAMLRSERIERDRLMPPLQALAFQRSLIDLHQQILQRRQDLLLAQTELAALVNLRPGTRMVLTAGSQEPEAAQLQPLDDIDALDQAALAGRPELREEDYRKRLSVLEARRAMLALLPGLDINLSDNHDSNKFLFRNSWSEASTTVSWNLFNVFAYPAKQRQMAVQDQLDDARRLALGMAVLTQVRIAAQRYDEAHQDYLVSLRGAEIDARIADNVRAATSASAESEMELLRAEVKAALSDMQRYVALANLQTAYARVANSVGADLLPAQPRMADLKQFSAQLAEADAAWRGTSFHTSAAVLPRPQVVLAAAVGPAGSALDLAALLGAQLRARGADVVEGGAGAAQVSALVRAGEPRAGVRAVEVVWSVRRGGALLGTVPYSSVISDSVPNAWAIFGASSAEAAGAKIAGLLKADAARVARKAPQ